MKRQRPDSQQGERGWVVLENWTRPPVPKDESRVPAEKRGDKRRGRAIGIVRLTPREERVPLAGRRESGHQ